MIKNVKKWLDARATYRKTMNELNALSDYELRDLGISRDAIMEIAHESAYGSSVVESNNNRNFFKILFGFFKITPKIDSNSRVNDWLAEANDIVDLERRLKLLDRGQAPWQLQTNRNLQGWS